MKSTVQKFDPSHVASRRSANERLAKVSRHVNAAGHLAMAKGRSGLSDGTDARVAPEGNER
jgi:hypothetical protein